MHDDTTARHRASESGREETAAGPAPAAKEAPATAPIPPRAPMDGAAGDPPPIVDDEEHAVDPRSVEHARVLGVAVVLSVWLAQLIGVTIAWAFGGMGGALYSTLLTLWSVSFVLALVWAYRWPALHHRHLRYRVDAEGVRIRRGVLWRKVISIPTSRVQHTDISQGPLQRRYEIATLTVYTAGTVGASIELAGLEQGVARRLRDHLLPEYVDDAAG